MAVSCLCAVLYGYRRLLLHRREGNSSVTRRRYFETPRMLLSSLVTSALLLLQAVSAFTGPSRHSASQGPRTELGVAARQEDAIQGKSRRVAIVLCPAQFCVPDDYQEFFAQLIKLTESDPTLPEIGTCRVAELPRTEWIKVAKKLPTLDFLQAKLPVYSTLNWYFDGIEKAIADIFATEGMDVNLCLIGHSIGGWVARGYLGGLSQSSTAVHRLAMERCTSLVTLGTPHLSPDSALVDQTRGLLREIEESPHCKPQALVDRGIDITCVSSSGLGANFLTTDIEEIVAASSYLPLLGRLGDVKGDGVVPLDLAFMEDPARRVVVEECLLTSERVRHSHVIPTPWNLLDGYAPSIRLPENYPSYVSEGVLPLWAKYIR